ncbi:MAG: alanine racemase [Ilumatobacteraceae bacterium]
MSRWAWAEIDLGAIRHNLEVLRGVAAPAAVWAVVKAEGYGHGSVPVAKAAMDAGAAGLCVALVQEGLALRDAGLDCPILVLSEQPPSELVAAVSAGLELTVYSYWQLDAIAVAGGQRHPVHLKIDTGMRRVGAAVDDALGLAEAIAESPAVRLAGVCTHFAMADEPADPFTTMQLEAFDDVLKALVLAGHRPPVVHAANSAATLAVPAARFDMVRTGIAIYGISPSRALDLRTAALRPALSLRARVAHVKEVRAGDRISYGLRHRFPADTIVATLPLGYADGVPRRLFAGGGEVLIGGRRRPIVGVVTMDQLMVDCGTDAVAVGDEAVLIGTQEGESISVNEWGDRVGTIGYEVVCGISQRVDRRYTSA